MLKIHVLTVKTCNPIVRKNELYKIIESKLANKINRMSKKDDTIKVFFRDSISFSDINKLAKAMKSLENVSVKEMKWRTEKINGTTCFLEIDVS